MEENVATTSLVEQIRAESLVIAGAEGRRLRLVAALAERVADKANAMLAAAPGVLGRPPDHGVVESAVVGEVQAVLGIGQGPAVRLVDLAQRLSSMLPETLDALQAGRLDLPRARVLAEATELLTPAAARLVQDNVLKHTGAAPWEGLSPRAWRARTERTVVGVDADAARRRRVVAQERRSVRSWPIGDGLAELCVTADAEQVAMAEQVLTDLAHARPDTDDCGRRVSMDQRRADAFVDLFARVRDGAGLPRLALRRERELGLVLHADTFFGDGPASRDPGEVRGLGRSTYLDAVTAREHAHSSARRGVVNVLMVDGEGALQRVVRLRRTPVGGWTRQLLVAALREELDALEHLPPIRIDGYAPTVAIADHVRDPHCASYDCSRDSARCDLDHDQPWPRGPTDVANLAPRCRRHHELKARRLVTTRLQPDGTLHTVYITGLRTVTRAEPLSGYAPGEGHHGRTVSAAGGAQAAAGPRRR